MYISNYSYKEDRGFDVLEIEMTNGDKIQVGSKDNVFPMTREDTMVVYIYRDGTMKEIEPYYPTDSIDNISLYVHGRCGYISVLNINDYRQLKVTERLL